MPPIVQIVIVIIGAIGMISAFIVVIGIRGSHQNPYGL